MRTRRGTTISAGFTLIELLTATALFAVLSAMLFQVVSQTTDVWRTGELNRELNDRAGAVLDLMAEDLRHAYAGSPDAAEQDARLLGLWRTDEEAPGRRLRAPVLGFTRVLYEERRLGWLRAAGDVVGGQAVPTLQPGMGAADSADWMATGGLAETLYTLAVLPGKPQPSLLRAVRARSGGRGSLLEPEFAQDVEAITAAASVLADDVLGLQIDYGEGQTVLTSWDSTRGLLSKDDPTFPWSLGPESVFDGSDDVWPAWIRLTLTLDDGAVTARLSEPLGGQGDRLTLDGGPVLDPGAALLVDREWLVVTGADGAALKVERAARGTEAQAHDEGAAVRIGRTYERTVRLPARRERYAR